MIPWLVQTGYWGRTKRPRSLQLHRNPGLELIYVARGKVAQQVQGGQPIVTQAGQISFTFPWQVHGALTPQVPANELYFVVLAAARDYQQPPRRFAMHGALGLPLPVTRELSRLLLQHPTQVAPASSALRWLLPRLVEAHTQPGAFQAGLLRGYATAALGELGRVLAEGERQDAQRADSRQSVARFASLLRQRCTEDWTLATMAQACGLGRSQFAALLLELTGDSPVVHLNRLRVEHAADRLQQEKRSVTEIAFAAGFQSSAYFCRVFRQFMGMTPTAYRAAGKS